MKKLGLLSSVITMILISLLLLSSCQKAKKNDVLSHIGSSEIASSDISTSEPEKETEAESSKPEETSKPETSSKPKPAVSSKPQESSKPTVSSKPAPTPSQTTSKVTSQVKPDSERIIGKWEATVDMAEDLQKEGFDIESPAMVKVSYEFTASNSAITTIDEASFRNIATPLLEQSLRMLVSQQYNMTLEDFAVQNETTIDALISASMEESVKNLTQATTYKLEGKTLYIKDAEPEEYTYSFVSDNKLSLTSDGTTIVFTRAK